MGYSAGHRLYKAKDGWLCLVLAEEEHWTSLFSAIGRPYLSADARFTSPESRQANDHALAQLIGEQLAGDTAARWMERLDRACVPAEVDCMRSSSSEAWSIPAAA